MGISVLKLLGGAEQGGPGWGEPSAWQGEGIHVVGCIPAWGSRGEGVSTEAVLNEQRRDFTVVGRGGQPHVDGGGQGFKAWMDLKDIYLCEGRAVVKMGDWLSKRDLDKEIYLG